MLPLSVTSTEVRGGGRSGEALRSVAGADSRRKISPLHFVPVEMTEGAFVPGEMTEGAFVPGEMTEGAFVPVDMTGVHADDRPVRTNF